MGNVRTLAGVCALLGVSVCHAHAGMIRLNDAMAPLLDIRTIDPGVSYVTQQTIDAAGLGAAPALRGSAWSDARVGAIVRSQTAPVVEQPEETSDARDDMFGAGGDLAALRRVVVR